MTLSRNVRYPRRMLQRYARGLESSAITKLLHQLARTWTKLSSVSHLAPSKILSLQPPPKTKTVRIKPISHIWVPTIRLIKIMVVKKMDLVGVDLWLKLASLTTCRMEDRLKGVDVDVIADITYII